MSVDSILHNMGVNCSGFAAESAESELKADINVKKLTAKIQLRKLAQAALGVVPEGLVQKFAGDEALAKLEAFKVSNLLAIRGGEKSNASEKFKRVASRITRRNLTKLALLFHVTAPIAQDAHRIDSTLLLTSTAEAVSTVTEGVASASISLIKGLKEIREGTIAVVSDMTTGVAIAGQGICQLTEVAAKYISKGSLPPLPEIPLPRMNLKDFIEAVPEMPELGPCGVKIFKEGKIAIQNALKDSAPEAVKCAIAEALVVVVESSDPVQVFEDICKKIIGADATEAFEHAREFANHKIRDVISSASDSVKGLLSRKASGGPS